MWLEELGVYIQNESSEALEWAKCGSSSVSAAPTLLWAAGAAALAHRLIGALFRRFLFRRVPWWEVLLQHLLFVWMVIYSVHFWVVFVRIVKVLVDYVYDETLNNVFEESLPAPWTRNLLQQWAVWFCGALPLAVYLHTRPRPEPAPLMIWYSEWTYLSDIYEPLLAKAQSLLEMLQQCTRITTSPWQRREMGPYGYYLQRPPAPASPPTPRPLRRAFSDSYVAAQPPSKKRYSKSV